MEGRSVLSIVVFRSSQTPPFLCRTNKTTITISLLIEKEKMYDSSRLIGNSNSYQAQTGHTITVITAVTISIGCYFHCHLAVLFITSLFLSLDHQSSLGMRLSHGTESSLLNTKVMIIDLVSFVRCQRHQWNSQDHVIMICVPILYFPLSYRYRLTARSLPFRNGHTKMSYEIVQKYAQKWSNRRSSKRLLDRTKLSQSCAAWKLVVPILRWSRAPARIYPGISLAIVDGPFPLMMTRRLSL